MKVINGWPKMQLTLGLKHNTAISKFVAKMWLGRHLGWTTSSGGQMNIGGTPHISRRNGAALETTFTQRWLTALTILVEGKARRW